MSIHIDFTPSTSSQLENGSCSVAKDLALVQESKGRWKLIDTRSEKASPSSTVIKGDNLVNLMQAVANGEKQLPAAFDTKEFQDLTKDPKFRGLCRRIPGIESSEHVESRARGKAALERAVGSAKIIGKGLGELEKQGLEGRFVGQDQDEQPYWIREVVFGGSLKPMGEVDIIIGGWSQDKTTRLSIKEWEAEKIKEWESLKPGQDFLKWVADQAWNTRVQSAWEKAHPGETFAPGKMASWKDAEADPELVLPVWLLKEFAGTSTDADFAKWRTGVIQERNEDWKRFKKETGVDLSFEEHERLSSHYSTSGAVESQPRWMLRQIWQSSAGSDNEDFTTFVRRLDYQKIHPGPVSEPEFKKWCASEEKKIRERYEGSHLPITFEEWRSQQDDGLLIDPAPFILLNEEQRTPYRTTCAGGCLVRNGHPYDTGFDKTRHSGEGYAIFVIGPDKNLYCGSHIGGVFHHSSFLGEGAIAAAGEVKTDPTGHVVELSSKSGHFQPKDPQNYYMLRYFSERDVDLANVKFTYYDSAGKTQARNAAEYLQELESGGLSVIDPSVFH